MTRIRTDLLPFQVVLFTSSAAVAGIITLFGELRDVLGFTETEIGVVVAAGFLGSFIAQVGLSRFADRGHGRRMVTIGVAMAALALFGMGVADGLWAWIGLRGLVGFSTGLIVPGVRRAAAVHDPDLVGENLGRLVVGDMSGFVLGPVAAALIERSFGFRAPFFVLMVLLLLFLPFAARLPADRGALDESGRRSAFDLLRLRRRLLEELADAADRLGEREDQRVALDELAQLDIDVNVDPHGAGRVYLLHARHAVSSGQFGLGIQ